jgi:hypothetical protein
VTIEYDYVLWYLYVYETIVVVTMVFVCDLLFLL